MHDLKRRSLLGSAGVALAGLAPAQSGGGRFVKSICRVCFPKQMPLAECFRQAKDAGFDAFEVPMTDELAPTVTPDQVKAVGDSAQRAGVSIAALWVSALGSNPL